MRRGRADPPRPRPCARPGPQAKKLRDRAAVVDLFNLLVNMDEPADLTPDDVKAVGDRYGLNMQKDQLQGLQQIFGQYLENIIPVGDTQLRWVDARPRGGARERSARGTRARRGGRGCGGALRAQRH